MEVLFEVIFTGLGEIIFNAYINLINNYFHTVKLKNWQRILLQIICTLIFFTTLTLIILGIIFLADNTINFYIALTMLIIGLFMLILHMVIAILAYKKDKKAKKNKQNEKLTNILKTEPKPIVYNSNIESENNQ